MNINTNQSKTENVLCCVPQGSILGSPLFFIFINDLHLFIGDSIRSMDSCTDDTTLYDIRLDKDTLENNLRRCLNLLKIWCLEIGMIINIDKTKLMFMYQAGKKEKVLRIISWQLCMIILICINKL